MWRTQRKAGLSFLNTANIRVLTDIALPHYLDSTLAHLQKQAAASSQQDKTTAIDLQAVFHELTSCIMGRMAYNMEMHADDEFTMAFDYASGATTERFQNPLWFITEAITGSADLHKSLAIVKAFGRRIVSTAVADRKAQHGGSPDSIGSSRQPSLSASHSSSTAESKINEVSGSLIQSLLDAISDQDIVADAALNYLSAGEFCFSTREFSRSQNCFFRLTADRQDATRSPRALPGPFTCSCRIRKSSTRFARKFSAFCLPARDVLTQTIAVATASTLRASRPQPCPIQWLSFMKACASSHPFLLRSSRSRPTI